jgi:hypothetical protein
MPAIKLYSFKDRDESHKKLEQVLAEGIYPRASCRENTNEPEPYSVWSDGPEPHILPPEPPKKEPMTEDEMLDRLAIKLLARLDKLTVK